MAKPEGKRGGKQVKPGHKARARTKRAAPKPTAAASASADAPAVRNGHAKSRANSRAGARTAGSPSSAAVARTSKQSAVRLWGELVLGEAASGRLLAFNHLPNSAGVSVRRYLRRAIPGDHRVRVGPLAASDPGTAGRTWKEALDKIGPEGMRRLQLVAGPEVGRAIAPLGRPATVFAVLREPVDLVIS